MFIITKFKNKIYFLKSLKMGLNIIVVQKEGEKKEK